MEAEVRNPAVHSGPTGSAAVAVAAAADPMAGVVGVAQAVERRIVGALAVRRGCTGVVLGCRTGLIAADARTIAAGTIRGAVEEVGMTAVAGCCHRIAEATCRVVGL